MSNLESLDTLIGGYLHEDWYLLYGDPWVAVETFVRNEPEYAPAVKADIERAVAESTSDHELENYLDKLGLGYSATTDSWSSYGAWLLAVAERVEELLRKSPAA